MPRLRPGLCALVVVSALLAGCTGGGGVSGPRATASVSPTEGDLAEPEISSPPPIFTEEDSVLNVAIPEPNSLDPMRLRDPGSVLVARQLFEGLTRWDPKREKVVPAAAERWRANPEGTSFAFRLREGMTFHDGSPVTSRSFKFAFDRIALRSNASDLAYTLELVDGFTAVNSTGSSRHLSGITTPDALTLVIRLSEPFHDFPAVLTHPGLVPLSTQALSDFDRFLTAPTGNGPFQIAEPWAPGQPVILRSFPGFIETPDVDGIRFLPYPDAAASWLPFVQGELHLAEVPAGQIGEARERYGEDGFLPFLAGYYYGLNIRSKSLGDKNVRRAINRSIDRDAIVDTIYKGALEAPRGIAPRGIPGFQEDVCLPLCTYSATASKRLVSKLNKKERRLKLEYTKGDPHGQVARFVKKDLEAAGFKVSVSSFEFARYLKLLRKGEQGVYRFGWIAEYPVADVFLSSLFASDSPDNYSGYSSAKVDRLLSEAHAERSEGRRLQLYLQAEKTIMRDVPLVPIGSFVTHWAAQPEVRGIRFDVMGGFDAVGVSLREN